MQKMSHTCLCNRCIFSIISKFHFEIHIYRSLNEIMTLCSWPNHCDRGFKLTCKYFLNFTNAMPKSFKIIIHKDHQGCHRRHFCQALGDFSTESGIY